MLKLTVVAPRGADVPPGARLYKLTPDQVRRRSHKLTPVDEGEGEKKKPRALTDVAVAGPGVMFKKGETILVDDALEDALAKDAFEDAEGLTLAARHIERRAAQRKQAAAKVEAAEKLNPPGKKAPVTERAVR